MVRVCFDGSAASGQGTDGGVAEYPEGQASLRNVAGLSHTEYEVITIAAIAGWKEHEICSNRARGELRFRVG